VSDCVDAVVATAATLVERLAATESSSVATVVAAVVLVAVALAAVAVERVAVVLVVAAIHPVRANRAATLSDPAMRRARRAGCGRRLGGGPVVIVPPRSGYDNSLGASGKRHLGFGEEPGKNPTGRSGSVLEAFLPISQLERNYGDEAGGMQDPQGTLR
jgi:hypothetical protein